MKTKTFLALTALMAMFAGSALAAQTGLWQFNGDLSAQVGSAITIKGGPAADAKVAFGTCSQLGAPLIGGNDAQIMRFLPFTLVTQGIEVNGNVTANGGGAYCNRWTLVMDFCTTSVLSNAFDVWEYSTPFDTSGSLGDDQGEMYFYYNGGNMQIGAGGRLGGYYNIPTVVMNWHRIVFTTDSAVGNVKVYFDGDLIGTFARGTLISALPDGKYSLDVSPLISLILFSAAAGGDEGGGYLNSLAMYDEVLDSAQIAELGGPTAAGIPAGVPTGDPNLKRHSQFLAYVHVDNRPQHSGDATGNYAIDNTWEAGSNGYYDFSTLYGGSLKLHHRANGDWDDPAILVNCTDSTPDMHHNIPLNSSLEIQVEWVPAFGAGRLEYFELNMDDATGLINGATVGDIQTRLYNLAYGSLGIECNNAAGNGSFRVLGQQNDTITNVRTILTYDPAVTQYHVYYEFNDSGMIIEAPGSPMTVTRTKAAFRIENEQDWRFDGGYTGHDIYIKDIKVFNAIQTTGPSSACVDGFALRRSSFSSPAGSCAVDAFWPLNMPRELNSIFMPGGVVDEYNGAGQYEIAHAGTNGVNANATISTHSGISDSTEWRLQVDCQFTSPGVGQAFAFKVDGNLASYFLVNMGNTANLMFGESNPFAPNPANVVALPVPADQINELDLIINYDSATQTYHAYYGINGGPLTWHPATNLSQVRASTSVEFQWQVWNTSPTDPYVVALDDYQEICGVQTILGPPLSVPDFMLHE